MGLSPPIRLHSTKSIIIFNTAAIIWHKVSQHKPWLAGDRLWVQKLDSDEARWCVLLTLLTETFLVGRLPASSSFTLATSTAHAHINYTNRDRCFTATGLKPRNILLPGITKLGKDRNDSTIPWQSLPACQYSASCLATSLLLQTAWLPAAWLEELLSEQIVNTAKKSCNGSVKCCLNNSMPTRCAMVYSTSASLQATVRRDALPDG